MQDTLFTAVPPLDYAPALFTWSLLAGGAVVGAGIALAAWWGVRNARHARVLSAAGGQLVVLRAPDGTCESMAVPARMATLFVTPPQPGRPLPAWRPEMAGAMERLAERARATDADAVAVECHVDGIRLRLVGLRAGDGASLIVSVAEAGPDEARLNRLETAALLSGGLAHDLRNVLNTLVLHAEVGADRTHDPARARTHFDSVRAGAMRAADLVSIIRRQLRGEELHAAPVVVRVGDAVREMLALLRPAFPHALRPVLDVEAPNAAVRVPEAVQLDQIVLNLVLNAVQAMEGRRDPRLRVAVALDAPPDAPAHAVLTVDDGGPGMSPEVRARCFDPYFTTKAQKSGTGLGLAVVRALVVDVLGGTIAVDESPWGGARFVVRLPAVVATDTAHALDAEPPALTSV